MMINQFTDALLLKNKELLKWPSQRKLFSALYLLILTLLASLLIIFWSVSNFNSEEVVNNLKTVTFEIKDNQLNLKDEPTLSKIALGDNLFLDKEFLEYNGIRISYQQLTQFANKEPLSSSDFTHLLQKNSNEIRFFIFIYAYLKALPFIFVTLLFSLIIGKFCHNLLKKNFDLSFSKAYMYTCYAFTPPLFLFIVLNLVTHKLFSYLWPLLLLTAINVFYIIWLKNKEISINN